MSNNAPFPGQALTQNGLNRHAIFNVAELPEAIRTTLGAENGQLILIGHGGKRLWEAVTASGHSGSDPIDDFTVATLQHWFAEHLAGHRYRILYPGEQPIPLQTLGQLADWHHPSPFMVGIDAEWGTWFAYRAVILADTDFLPTVPLDRSHPCLTCQDKPCLASCPAEALDGGHFALQKCLGYRMQAQSKCQFTCLARVSCPVGAVHRYDEAQLRHTYAISLKAIARYCQNSAD